MDHITQTGLICKCPYFIFDHLFDSGTVLHFLVRLPPFTQLFLEYQDSSFDIPDRTFHSMETTYRLSSFASTTDVKELIPEFFFLPEFLCNLEGAPDPILILYLLVMLQDLTSGIGSVACGFIMSICRHGAKKILDYSSLFIAR